MVVVVTFDSPTSLLVNVWDVVPIVFLIVTNEMCGVTNPSGATMSHIYILNILTPIFQLWWLLDLTSLLAFGNTIFWILDMMTCKY